MRPRPLYLALLCLALFVFSCSNSDKPTELVTSPGDAMREAGSAVLNTCPILSSPSPATVAEDGQTLISINPYDADADDELTIIITDHPSLGSVNQFGSHSIRYTARFNRCGSDSFKFKVNDGTCDSPEVTAIVTVTCVNDCPEGEHGNISVTEGSSVGFELEGNDDDGDELEYSVTAAPAHGSVVLQAEEGAGTYTPAAGYNGPDSFKYRVSDGQCNSSEYTINVNVNPLVTDADDDGVPDADDDCDNSNTSSTVSVDGCDSGVANPVDGNGCSLADKVATEVAAAAAAATNHGKFVSSMAKRLNAMVTAGTITAEEKEALMHCVGSSSVSKQN